MGQDLVEGGCDKEAQRVVLTIRNMNVTDQALNRVQLQNWLCAIIRGTKYHDIIGSCHCKIICCVRKPLNLDDKINRIVKLQVLFTLHLKVVIKLNNPDNIQSINSKSLSCMFISVNPNQR